jgi:membrane associated rhomboid family serine protease
VSPPLEPEHPVGREGPWRAVGTALATLVPFTPVGSDGRLSRVPVATLGLIAVNVLAFLLAWPIQRRDQEVTNGALARLAERELAIEAAWLGGSPAPVGVPSRFRGRNATERAFWAAFDAGRIVPEGHEDLEAWRRAREAYRQARLDSLYVRWGLHPGNRNPVAWLTAAFLHFGFVHLAGNMLFLWIAGSALEDLWGPHLLLLIFLVSALLAAAPDAFLTEPRDVVSVGASGAVAGLMGAFLVRLHSRRLRLLILPMMPTVLVPAWCLILPWAAFELRAAMSGRFTGVGHWAHVGGFAAGALLALALRLGDADRAARDGLSARDRRRSRRRREALERQAVSKRRRGDHEGALRDLLAGCRVDPGAHGAYARALEILSLSGGTDAARALVRDTLAALRRQGRRDEHARAFELAAGHGLEESVEPVDVLHAADRLAAERPRETARLLHALLSREPDAPIASRALRRYASLLERLGDPDGAAEVRRRRESLREHAPD